MLVRSSNGSYEFIDFRETAPAAAFEEMFVNNTAAITTGGLASGVPGQLRGLQYLHDKYGKLPWKTVLQPAVKLAREGWRVNEDLVSIMKFATNGAAEDNSTNFLTQDPAFAMDFAPKGHLVKLNDTITRKRYADTIETIANEGADAFYEGPIAEATIRALQAKNGTMTLEDLKNYTVALREPSTITYRNFKLTSGSAPCGGEVALSVLKFMEGYDGVYNSLKTNTTTHLLDESMRFAYGMRAYLGDPSFVDGVDEFQKRMYSEEIAKEVRAKISDKNTFDVSYYNAEGLESLETPGTSQVVAADNSGMAISLTTTINLYFGSRLVVPETGVIMNCEMSDFSTPGVTNAFGYRPSPANFIRPGKRPLSSISPVIVEHLNSSIVNPFYVAVGAAGGSRIITSTIQNLMNVLDKGMTIAEALAAPRMHEQLTPAQTTFEYSFDNSTVAYLKEIGHNVTWVAPGESSAQGLRMLPNGTFEAAGEPRQKYSGGFAV